MQSGVSQITLGNSKCCATRPAPKGVGTLTEAWMAMWVQIVDAGVFMQEQEC